ncbi:Non-structural maintenance of chromosomes element 1 [Apophysomyces sp. BC1034]|nr:Non-structural maintenance of chromosomes element 1 [Apophysomyces sp. BC1015]KAG0180399.1 Non-structural maintenance of chromosomes element 1 [Apophysomyces sp. BC1021]KAG0190952.1 Non-structural maintenance of chromosomes element 1 [Apophysomyces sp. BC1034]
MDTSVNPNYNDSHRLFLQSMLSHRIISEDQALELYDRACQLTSGNHAVVFERSLTSLRLVPKVDFAAFLTAINRQINEIDLALRRSHDEKDGHAIIGLVNTKDDEISQVATNYTASEITYVRQLIELIVMADDDDFAVKSMVAIRLGQKMKPPISQKDTEDLLDRLVRDEWLEYVPSGAYLMNTRTIMELQGYLREQYSDYMKECVMCLEIVTMGERCELQDCQVRMHRHCADNYFREHSNMRCLTCSTQWSRSNVFGLGLPL